MSKDSSKIKKTIPAYKKLFWGLVAANAILILAAAGAFLAGYQQLQVRATEAQAAIAAAEVSRQQLTNMQSLRGQLDSLKPVVVSANKMAAPLEAHRYQDQTVQIIGQMARSNNITITQVDFSIDKEANPTNSKSVIARITLKSPVSYNNFLNFLLTLESQITPLHLTSVSLQKSPEVDQAILVGDIEFKIYVK